VSTWRQEAFIYNGSTVLKGGEVMKALAFGTCDVATAVTDKILGIAVSAAPASSNYNLGLYMPGQVVRMQASAAISFGAYVMPTTAGQIVTATAKNGTGNTTVSWYLGYALEAAANANEVIAVYFWPTEINI